MTLTGPSVRQVLADCLRQAVVCRPGQSAMLDAFVQEDQPCPLHAFDMDSLAAMEFCIALELALGHEVTTAELESMPTLNDLAGRIGSAG